MRRKEVLVAELLLLIYVLQCAWFARTQSMTFDEPIHTYTGLELWRTGGFEHWIEQPPLGRILLALPITGKQFQMKIQDADAWFYVVGIRPGPQNFIAGPRMMNIMLGVLLGILVWFAVRRLYGGGAAGFALALFAFSPQLIAHFSVATTDGIGVLTVFLIAFQLVRWRSDPSRLQTMFLGLAFGLALLAKFYSPPFIVLAMLLVLFTPRTNSAERVAAFSWRPRDWSWKPVLVAAAIAAFTLWAGYLFHVGHVSVHEGQLVATFPNRTPIVQTVPLNFNLDSPLPAGEFFAGLDTLYLHNRQGHPSFLLGKRYIDAAPHWYFPAAIALKWPTISLLLGLAGFALVVARGWTNTHKRIDGAIYGAFGLVALLSAISARLTIGDRHVMSLYPFLLIGAATVWHLASNLSARRNLVLGVLMALAALNAADVLRYAPGYLSYFNVFVSPKRSYELLSDSNLDWGQGLLAVKDYEREHPEEATHLAYFGSVAPALYGIKAAPFSPGERVSGTVMVSATLLSGQYLRAPDGYRWLLSYPLKTILDHSIFVFNVPSQNRTLSEN